MSQEPHLLSLIVRFLYPFFTPKLYVWNLNENLFLGENMIKQILDQGLGASLKHFIAPYLFELILGAN